MPNSNGSGDVWRVRRIMPGDEAGLIDFWRRTWTKHLRTEPRKSTFE